MFYSFTMSLNHRKVCLFEYLERIYRDGSNRFYILNVNIDEYPGFNLVGGGQHVAKIEKKEQYRLWSVKV